MSTTRNGRVIAAAVMIMTGIGVYWIARAGSLEPPGPPAPTMVTLAQIDAKLSALTGASRHFVFVGVTTATFRGDGTRAAMTAACASQFPGSRMAFSDEYATTISPPTITTAAWIQPRPAVGTTMGGIVLLFDAAGDRLGSDAYSCDAWSYAGDGGQGSGRVLYPHGGSANSLCTNVYAVACSAPE